MAHRNAVAIDGVELMLQRLFTWLGLDSWAAERRRRRLLARFPNHLALIDSREIPLGSSGCPDLSYLTESPEFYFDLIVDSARHLKDKPHGATAADREMASVAYNRIVNADWGLIARGSQAIPYAIKLVRSSDRDHREAATNVFCGLRNPERLPEIVSEIVAALESEDDRLVIDCLLGALGHLRSREAIPILARFILNPSEDADSRFDAAVSLGNIMRIRFEKRGNDAVQQACSWLADHGYHEP